MNEQQYRRVLAACLSQRAKGVTIEQGDWGIDLVDYADGQYLVKTDSDVEPCACGLACYILEENPTAVRYRPIDSLAAELLGATDEEVGAFVTGFDFCDADEVDASHMDWFNAGHRLAVELGFVEAT